MALKLRSKVALGGVFLFLLLLLVGAVSFYHFNKLISGTRNVVKANYETVEYGKNMLLAISEWPADSAAARKLFEENLQKQIGNITEIGEQELTFSLQKNYQAYIHNPDSLSLLNEVQANIARIVEVNLQAINQKTQLYQQAAEDAKLIISVIITISLLMGFTFLLNFPGLVAGPITKLTEAIRAIAARNYGYRIHLNRKDEFGEMAEAFNHMAEQLDRYEHSNLARIMFEKQRAETVIHSFKNASIGIDTAGTILFANQQALQLLNLGETDIVGKTESEVKKQNDLFRFLLESEKNTPVKIVINDRENYFNRESIEIKNGEERIGKMIILENITSFKEMDTAKTNFIATVSHELKTPLASSDFSLKLLEDERTGAAERKELIKQLKNDNQRMLSILSELLNMSQVEAGKMQLDIRPIEVLPAVEESLEAGRASARKKNIILELSRPAELPVILADADKVTWIINNFLTNAIKFSPEGGSIWTKLEMKDNQLSISVTDEGIGIEPKFLDRVFDRYFQIPGATNKAGSGIGLSICKEMAEAMNGRVWVKSEWGRGSTFGIDLPLAPVQSA